MSIFLFSVHSILKPQKLTGVVEIVATADKYTDGRRKRSLSQKLQGAIKLLLVEHARAAPSSIVLLNEKMASKTIRLKHGSGHFALMAYDGTVVDANLDNSIVKVFHLKPFWIMLQKQSSFQLLFCDHVVGIFVVEIASCISIS